MPYDAIDLFAGPGGWDVAARDLGLDVLGVEFDHAACETRRAAGLATVEADVRDLNPLDYDAPGFIASPPCQTFSMAGKGAGRAVLDALCFAIRHNSMHELMRIGDVDERTLLVLEPLRWILARAENGNPFEWIAMEQVPAVLPIWEAYAETLREFGYSVATGVLNAEQYGVPQTRRRAVLVARLIGEAKLPTPTHSRYHSRDKARRDEGVLKWVSMAEALGWGMTARLAGGTAAGGADSAMVGGSGARRTLYAERAAGRWVQESNYSAPGKPGQTAAERGLGKRQLDEPSFGLTSKATRWVYRPNAVAHADEKIRVTPTEAAILQTFPADYPWWGTKTKQFEQIGNAVPPLLARAVLAPLVPVAAVADIAA